MNTSSNSQSFSMPMPLPAAKSSHQPASLPLLPSAPAVDIQANQFTHFFKVEDANSSLPYPTMRQHCYYIKLDIKRDWNVDYAAKDSQKFREMAVELENELRTLLTVDESYKIHLVHAQKDRWSSRRILLTFVVQSLVKFTAEKFENLLRDHIRSEEKILTTRAYLRDLKVRKIQNYGEYEHLLVYGCNPCAVCDQVLQKHRKLNVNHPAVTVDILSFLVVLLTLGLVLTITLLVVLK